MPAALATAACLRGCGDPLGPAGVGVNRPGVRVTHLSPRPCLGDSPSWTQRGSLPASPSAGLSVPEAEPSCSHVGPKREWATSSEPPSSREDPSRAQWGWGRGTRAPGGKKRHWKVLCPDPGRGLQPAAHSCPQRPASGKGARPGPRGQSDHMGRRAGQAERSPCVCAKISPVPMGRLAPGTETPQWAIRDPDGRGSCG